MINNTIRRLFVDLDGTSAEWKNVANVEALYERGFFRTLKPHISVVQAINQIIDDGLAEVYTLSAFIPESRYAIAEKNEWINEFYPNIDKKHRIFVPCGVPKALAVPCGVRCTDLLLDDYSTNLKQWAEHARGIKLLNGINGNNGSWSGPTTTRFNTPEEIVADILHALSAPKLIRFASKNGLLGAIFEYQGIEKFHAIIRQGEEYYISTGTVMQNTYQKYYLSHTTIKQFKHFFASRNCSTI